MNDITPPPPAPTRPKSPGLGSRGGQKAPRRQPKSRYGVQMEEKQNLKELFGIREEQLRKYYAQARRAKEQTGKELIALLERRLDNAVYRAGFAPTRAAARQLTTHRIFSVNNRPVDIPSYCLKSGDVVSVRSSKRTKALFANFVKRMQNVHSPSWIVIDAEDFSFRVTAIPTIEEANVGVDVQAIVEFFAR
ncbi:MAG: 30S ribosomal protein S4 [Candidatus Andersenbacteria bacterium]